MKHITSLWLLMFLFASTAMFAQVASSGDDPAMVQYKMEQVRLNAAADVQPGVIPGSPQTTGNHYSKYISSDASRAILWDNGGFVTAEGVGSGGSDYSELQDASLGMGTYGSGAQLTAGNSIADDFDVVGGWNVVSFTFFAYQTGSGPPSTLTGVYVQVYDGNPSAGGSLIWGDLTTNRMLSTTWTNAWRVLESGPSENRPIMNIVADASGLSLSAGTYWVEMSLTGSGASGPWAPPVTLVGETTTGNSIQKTSTGWAPLVDIGPQGLPFIVEGTAGAPPTNDVGVFAIPQPVSGVDLTNAEPVTITIKNSGTAAQSNVPYMVTWDGPTGSQTVNGTYTGSIAAGATVDVTLSQTADLSVYGDYAFEACTQLAGDEYAGNDCKTKTVTNAFPAYCAASTTTEDEYIANVLCGTIDNTSGWQGGVADYTAFSTAIAAGAAEAITVTNGNPWASDIVYCWVDWNSNWVYEQATDEEYILTSDGTGLTFTGDITVPAGTPEGDYRMRIRMTYSTAPVPCGSASYGEIEEYTIQVGEGGGPVGNPPENFTAVYTEDIGVECNWEYSPGTWVGYDDGFNNDGLGLNGGGTFWGAIRWDAADLAGFDGWYMSSFKFFPRLFATPATMKFMIWEGADAANLVYEQVLSGLTWDEWNEIALNEMHMIDASMDLWIGIEVTHVDAEYPLGYDAGPAVAGYGDMVSLDGSTWASMSNEWGLDYNFNLKGLLVENADGIVGNKTVLAQNTISNPTGVLAAGNLKPAVNPAGSRAFLGFNVYRDGEQVNAAIITDNSYIDVYSTPGTYMYTAKTVYDEGLSDPTPEVEVIITGEPNPVVVFEPFEDYTAGGYLVQQAVAQGKSYWTTWSNAPGTAEDPFVSSAQAYAGNNSVVIEGTNDAVLLLDNYTEGVFNVDFRIYIPSGKIGYFNMLQLFNGASSQWGMQAYFDVDGAGLVDAGAAGAGVFTYTYDTWHNVSVDVDLDADWAEMFLNGTSIVAWQWSTGSFGTGTLNAFNAMNFYAWAENGTPGAFFDNIDITMGGEPMAPEIAVNPTSLNESHTTPPQVTTKTLTITNTGTETLNWDITLDLGGTDASIVPYYNEAEAIRVLEERLAAEGKTFSSPAYIKANEPGNATDAITCPPDALISQPAVNFATAYTMDEDAGYTVYQSFTGAGDIGGIRFWTISAFFDGAAWGPCDGIDPRPFDIGFWQDAGGSVGANIATYEGIELTRTATGDLFAGTYPIYEYTAEFDAVTVEAGWFSIQSMIGTAVNCWNLALNQPGGAGNCLQYDGAAWTAQPDPLGFCLIEGIATVYANDVSISSIVQPASGVDLTNAEPVTIKIKNNGTTTQTSIPWTVTWDGPTGAQTASGTYAGSLVQGATVDVTLTQTADLSIYGDYTFEACTGLAGDENAANDCKTKVVVNAMPVYCDASTTTEDEWIANVLCGSIDNSSGWQGGVADYTAISTEIGVGASEAITITNGNAWASDIVTCWVDWNMNYTFEQGTDEEFFTTNVGGTGLTFTGNITVPEGTSGGAYRMRVRMTYSTAPVPCGNASYGEIEDYTIVVPGGPATDWLAVDLTTGSVEPGQSQVVTVTFNSTGLAMDTYVGSINIASNAATNPMVMVPATLNVGMAPVIAVSPAQIDEVHPTPPQMTTKTLSITNNGSSVLNWDIALNLGGTDASIVPYFDHAEALRVLEERLSAEGSALSADVEPGVSAGQPQTSGDHYSKHISSDASRAILYDNGGFVTAEGVGSGGSDYSELQDASLGMGTYGSGAQLTAGNSIADDFEVSGSWNVTSFTFFAYQTGSGPPSTLTGVYVQLYDGNPSAGGSLIWGDFTTNRMLSTTWTNAWRVLESGPSENRPIMNIVADASGLFLNAGTYWVEVSLTGSGASGPWCPPITIVGETTTGNSIQKTSTGWAPLVDIGPQGLPFIVEGTTGSQPANDVGVLAITQPVSGVNLTNAETVAITIKNYGTATQTSVPYTVTWDGPTGAESVTGTYTGSIASNEVVEVTLSATADLSVLGDYAFEACTQLAGDEYADNDCKTKTVTNAFPEYCGATTTTEDEWIANVLCGTINNSSGWQGGVANYTDIFTEIEAGASEAITITNGNAWASDIVTCWVDWNMNYVFDQGTNEEFFTTNVGGTGLTFTGNIAVPEGTPGGDYTMRVRMTYSTAPVPCGSASYGEVEDYTIKVGGGAPWLSVDLMSGTINPGESQDVTVTFNSNGLPGGTYYGSISVNSSEPTIVVPVTLNVGGGPEISVNPDNFLFVLYPSQESTQVMGVSNVGNGTIDYSMSITYSAEAYSSEIPAHTNHVFNGTNDAEQFIESDIPSVTDAITCPPDAIFSQPAANFATAYTMDEDAGYTVYQSMPVGGVISGIRFWTISAYFNGTAWGPCEGINPRPFDIGFWSNNGGNPGANLMMLEGVDLNRTATGDMFAGTYPVYEYTATFSPVAVSAGDWFSLQSMGTGLNCWNLALNEPGGQGSAIQYDGSAWTPQADPLGFCLIGGELNEWLSVNPTSGSVSGGQTDNIDVTCNTYGFADNLFFYATIWVASNDIANPLVQVDVTLEVIIGVGEGQESSYIMMYPNPTNDVVNISTNSQLRMVTVLNQVGQIVIEQEVNANSVAISTAQLQKGIYFVKIMSEAGESIQKLIVQ